jgi:hypothetical protein
MVEPETLAPEAPKYTVPAGYEASREVILADCAAAVASSMKVQAVAFARQRERIEILSRCLTAQEV